MGPIAIRASPRLYRKGLPGETGGQGSSGTGGGLASLDSESRFGSTSRVTVGWSVSESTWTSVGGHSNSHVYFARAGDSPPSYT